MHETLGSISSKKRGKEGGVGREEVAGKEEREKVWQGQKERGDRCLVTFLRRSKLERTKKCYPINQEWWHTPGTPEFRRWNQEDRGFKIILGYTVSLRLACTTWDPVSKRKSAYVTEWCHISQSSPSPCLSTAPVNIPPHRVHFKMRDKM